MHRGFEMLPEEILFIGSHELVLDRRREELWLQYTVWLKSSHKNPTFKVFGNVVLMGLEDHPTSSDEADGLLSSNKIS